MAQHTSTAVSLDEIAAAAGVSPADLAAGVLRSEDNLGAVPGCTADAAENVAFEFVSPRVRRRG